MKELKTLLLYSSVDGQTYKICRKITDILIRENHSVDFVSIHEYHNDSNNYDKIIVASSIRYGKHNPKIVEYINRNTEWLNSMNSAFISVNLVARKPEKNEPHTNPYVVKFLKSIKWKPKITVVFAGKLDYKKYSLFDRLMIKLIMLITKGPTDTNTDIDYTNWERVDEFGRQMAAMHLSHA